VDILYVGALLPGQTALARMEGLGAMGLRVEPLDSGGFFRRQPRLIRALEVRTYVGPGIVTLNRRLLQLAARHRPAVVWIDKGVFIYAGTLRRLRALGCVLVHYNTDDILCRRHPFFILRRTIPLYDLHFTTNRANVEDLKRLGARAVAPSSLRYDQRHFSPRRFEAGDLAPYRSDTVFVGHWEPATEDAVLQIVAAGIDLRVWGENWRRAQAKDRLGEAVMHRSLWLDDYVKALLASKIALGFLSKWNRNTAACRSFEIPAVGGFLLAERTDEHLESYREGVEAEFFGDHKEMLDKLRYYLEHETERRDIARRGHERCLASGYSYGAQMPRDWRHVKALLA
jgi:spore maturation protein CgeB